jgi:phospholipid/cholesterol/gamma-HCH transport system substrate-binding protein
VLVVLVLFTGGSSYTLKAEFQDAGGLVPGNIVLVGPSEVGSVQSIGLTPDGQAEVTMSVDSDAAPLTQGTVARIYENSLSGSANKYVVLEPGPSGAPSIPSGGMIGEDHTYSEVNLDELFDTLDPLTRAGLRNFIRGQAASINGRAKLANQTLQYFAPALASTSEVTQELTRDEPAFDGLLVEGAQTMQALASRSEELTQLIANTSTTTGAIASQAQALEQALQLLPPALNHSTSTFAGLRTTLNSLDPLVNASKPASRQLRQFAIALHTLTDESIPTIGALDGLIHNPSGTGDLTTLFLQTPSLAKLAAAVFPHLISEMNSSQAQVDYFRDYTPDVVAALTNLGQVSANYDANGHYARTQPFFNAFGLNGANQLVSKSPALRYQGLTVVHGRCPGSAVQPPPDGSAPQAVPGCNPSATLPGP